MRMMRIGALGLVAAMSAGLMRAGEPGGWKEVRLETVVELLPFNTPWSPWTDASNGVVFASGRASPEGGDMHLEISAAGENEEIRWRLSGWSAQDAGGWPPSKLEVPAGLGAKAWVNPEYWKSGRLYLARQGANGALVALWAGETAFKLIPEPAGFNPAFRRYRVEGTVTLRYLGPFAAPGELVTALKKAPRPDAPPPASPPAVAPRLIELRIEPPVEKRVEPPPRLPHEPVTDPAPEAE